MTYIRWFDELGRESVAEAGGKGANLGEMVRAGLPIPRGFVVTAEAFRAFTAPFHDRLAAGLTAAREKEGADLRAIAGSLREQVRAAPLPPAIEREIAEAYSRLADGATEPPVAVRSSATAEDAADHSFAGMFESFLNVRGATALLEKVRACWASLFSARVLSYLDRASAGNPAMAVIVQAMVDARASGVLFTADPKSGDRDVLVIESAFGLGEVVVGGQVTPDHYAVDKRSGGVRERVLGHKRFELIRDAETGATRRHDLPADKADAPSLSDAEVTALVGLAMRDEAHYGAPQDAEFAVSQEGAIYLVQTRPITTITARRPAVTGDGTAARDRAGAARVRGLGASPGRASGVVRVLHAPAEGDHLRQGEVLVAPMTAPDWVPFMRRAAAIVTDAGGMTSHAAIVSRELGLPCVVGTSMATRTLHDGEVVTVDGGTGVVFAGEAEAPPAPRSGARRPAPLIERARPVTATAIYVNLAEPDRAAEMAALPVDGVGLLRAEFLILEALEGVHPRLLLERKQGQRFVDAMVAGLATIARAFAPRPVIYRSMDFRTNEFRGLQGGERFEPVEANPMIGFRGCYRYVREPELFRLELAALAAARRDLANLHLMIPFVRTAWELRECRRLIGASALAGDRHLQLWVMAEVPSVAYWIPTYAAEGITGVSIGSNDLTQLVLGVDRDSELLAPLYDERDPAVLHAIHAIIRASHQAGIRCSICGQAPSVHPDYAERLVRWGIDSISVNPDSVDAAIREVAAAEQRILLAETLSRLEHNGHGAEDDGGRWPGH